MTIKGLHTRLKRRLATHKWYTPGNFILSVRRLALLSFLIIKRKLRLDYSFYPPGPSSVALDIFMPTVEKDAAMLEHSLKGIRENILHPITNIYIVAPENALMVKRVAKKYNCVFINEASIIPLQKDQIDYVKNGENRAGWVYKMLLNLSADTVCSEKYILIVDSDTVFIRPQIFLYNNKPLFNLGDSYHTPYFMANERLFGLSHRISRSFVTHYMLFDGDILKELRRSIELSNNGTPWYEAIINCIDTNEGSGFADYEIYGDFYRERLGLACILNNWSNISLEIDSFNNLSELIAKAKPHYASISLHNYNRD